MRKSWKKRGAAFLLAAVIAAGAAGCAPKNEPSADGGTQSGQNAADGKLFSEPTEVSMVVGSHVSWPYKEDWLIWQCFEEATGADFKVTAIPNENFQTKINLMMASPSELPDLIYADGKSYSDDFASAGAIVAIDDYEDIMPNYKAFWNSLPEEEREDRLVQRRYADGKTYYPQLYGTDERQGIRAWLYRKDVFEKHNLAVPTTMEEVYQVCKKLKELYPESYPFCLREGLRNIGVMGAQWKPYFTWETYYDFENEKWSYGAAEPTMLEMVKYMRRMMEEQLLPPDYLTAPAKTWEELMTTDRGFILADFVVRVDNFNNPCRKENPEYTLAAMTPPKADTPTATNMVNKFNVDTKGYMICNTGNKKRMENAVRVVDWMYSDEAAEILAWGKEGVSYEVKDGEKQFIRPAEGDIEGEYGIFSYGTYLRVDPKAARAIASDEQQAAVDIALENTIDKYNPMYWLSLTDEEKAEKDTLNDSIRTFAEENLSKFLLGSKPLSDWDSFVTELNKLGVEDMLAIYDAAYKRVAK